MSVFVCFKFLQVLSFTSARWYRDVVLKFWGFFCEVRAGKDGIPTEHGRKTSVCVVGRGIEGTG